MAEEANLGRWEAREVEPVEIATPARARSDRHSPLLTDEADEAVGDRGGSDDPEDGGDQRFWLGVAVGLVPLLLVVGGYLLVQLLDGEEADADGATLTTDAGQATAGTATPSTDIPVETRATPTPSSVASADAVTPATVEGSNPTAPTAPSPSVVATGMVTDGAIEVSGILPDDLRTQWIAELADLAAVLGYRLDDRTEIAAGAAAGPQEANELLVRFPGAVVFRPDSPQSFDGEAQPIFEAVAGVLNRGTAELNIVGYADPTDPDAALLALARAEHVHEHLVDLGVGGERLTIEARPPAEAPIVAAEGSSIERRADLEFRFRP